MEWDNIVVPLKETGNFLGQPDLTKRGIQQFVMQTSELYSTIEATQIVVKILESTCETADLDKVDAAAFQLDKNQRKNVLCFLTEFEDLFEETLVKWDANPIDLELNRISKPFNARY